MPCRVAVLASWRRALTRVCYLHSPLHHTVPTYSGEWGYAQSVFVSTDMQAKLVARQVRAHAHLQSSAAVWQ